MSNEFYAFGEMLWDCLPSGKHAGGAPFNVTAHLAQLQVPACLISAIGQDDLGDEILAVAKHKGIDTRFVRRVRVGLPTGVVLAKVDETTGNATYELVSPAAWDEITVPDESLAALAEAKAVVFGSLAGRSLYNLDQLDRLLSVSGPTKFFDVNLRPPFAEPPQVVKLAQRADVLKLNHDEVGQLAAWIKTGTAAASSPKDVEEVATACAVLADRTETRCICVTMGPGGAVLWDRGTAVHAPAPSVAVKDTVGAGDAFMAGLMVGLTHGVPAHVVLDAACRLGAYVASHHGATPVLPPELLRELALSLKGSSQTAA